MLLHVAQKILARKAVYGLFRAEDLGLDRRSRKELFAGAVEHDVLRAVLGHGDLLEHDALFARHLLRIERAPKNDVRKHVDRFFEILVQRLHVEAGALLCGECVEVRPDRVHFRGNVRSAARFGALEEHVLDEVGNARLRVRLKDRARVDPHADRHRAHRRHMLRHHADAVFENGRFDHIRYLRL